MTEENPYPFVQHELDRLKTYKAAFEARFYTDTLPPERAARCTGFCSWHTIGKGAKYCASCGRPEAA